MVLEKVLKQAGRHSRPQVRICVRTPLASEAPDLIRMLRDMLGHIDHRLPARVPIAVRGLLAWKDPLRFPYGLADSHRFS
jgi:hypothetical protein